MIDSPWLLPALILNTLAMALVFGLSGLVLRRYPLPYFRWWVRSAGWRVLSSMAGTLYGLYYQWPWLALLSIAGMVAGSLCLIDAALAYRGRSAGRPWRWWLAGALLALSIGLIVARGDLPEVFYLPAFLLLAASQAMIAWAFWPRAGEGVGLGAPIVAVVTGVWAVDSLAYPALIAWHPGLLAPMTSFSGLLTITVGMGMIVHLLEQSLAREQTLGREVQERDTVAQEREALVRQIVHDLRNSTQALGLIAETIEDEAAGNARLLASVGALDRQLTFISNFLRQKLASSVGGADGHEPGTEIAPVLEGIEVTFRPIVASKGQVLVFEPPSGAPSPLRISPIELDQVLGNLVMNAHQHCATGASIRLESAFSDGWATFRVADDGPGIPPERQAALGRTPPRPDGTGVGLRNVYDLVTRAGGSFGVVSRPGAGTIFHVTLPLMSWGLSANARPPASAGDQSAILQ